ncbi:DUF397 domain-containing protein [Streptomyces sp. WAC 01529]|uniref:DUF397 domain-containing protein n=1 Tax=Streptomyces sp. WAC 01529 TaxID=2203205 RepID=UPI000F6CD833|nr:DUF397 domain-containing protein [Streptomyces sp. WAC 01529]AZM53246.1 DUF397 domain-containing protein [Streptomyces sp. WAC 01529]
METNQRLAGATWRKSSYSSDTGGQCIECAPLGTAAWRKSSHSGDTGGQCVEVADLNAHVAIRDSKNPEGPAFAVAPGAFAAFVSAAAKGSV